MISCAFLAVLGSVYNIHLYTDSCPDLTDIRSYVRSITRNWKTPQEKAIAIWRHSCRLRRQTSSAAEKGRLIFDPILHFTSYGYMNCGIISAINCASFENAGMRSRYIELGDHTVSEASWDEGRTWHLFDSSMSVYCFNHEGTVASSEEIKSSAGCELSGGIEEPGHYYLYHYAPECGTHPNGWRSCSDRPVGYGRTLEKGASSYTDGFSVQSFSQYAQYGRRYILNLRPYERYTRWYEPLDNSAKGGDVKADDPDYYRPLEGKDPDDQHGLNNIRGNGVWVFSPELSGRDARALAYDDWGVRWTASPPYVRPSRPGREGWVDFKVWAANVVSSCVVEGRTVAGKADEIRMLVSRDCGMNWKEVWKERGGATEFRVKLRDELAGHTEYLVRFAMKARSLRSRVGLEGLSIKTVTQLNRRALPFLRLGSNKVRLKLGLQAESMVLWPVIHKGGHRETVSASRGLYSADGISFYKSVLGAARKGEVCFAQWSLRAPRRIVETTYGARVCNRSNRSRVTLLNSRDGRRFVPFFEKRDGSEPFDRMVLKTFRPRRHAKEAHLRCEFFSESESSRLNTPGIQDVFLRVYHEPREKKFVPIEVTLSWTEHRRGKSVPRTHTHIVRKTPETWTVNVAGSRPPTMNCLRLNLRGHGPRRRVREGYSDGEDPGDRDGHRPVVCEWGNNVALGKSYTSSRPSCEENPDADGRELTNGVVMAPSPLFAEPARRRVQEATAGWPAGKRVSFVVDLGEERELAGARVCTHQPNENYCHPRLIEVSVSRRGRRWIRAGVIKHDDLYKPPGNWLPWEHDDDPDFEGLAAKGRLAFRYPLVFPRPLWGRLVRFAFEPLPKKGLGISELEVYDSVGVKDWPQEVWLEEGAR